MKHLIISLLFISVCAFAKPVSAGVQTAVAIASVAVDKGIAVVKDTTFTAADKMPEPVGGMEALAKNVKYPKKAKKDGTQGTVFVSATIDESGKVTSATIMKSVGHGCDEAALTAVRKTTFTPAVKNGKKVKVQITVPINFKMEDDKKGRTKVKGMPGVPSLNSTGDAYIMAEKMPELIGGMEALMKKMVYPESAVKNSIEGKVYIQFVVNENGDPQDIVALRSLSPDCDEAAKNLVKTTKWIPGEQSNKKIKVQMVLPVMFRLH